MKKNPLVITASVAALVAVAAAAALYLLSARSTVSDPASARCAAPPTTFGEEHTVDGVRAVGVRFACNGARLAGTLYLPDGPGPHPAVVWVHGSGATPRLFPGSIVTPFLDAGIAVLSYDKRGVGASAGKCCPGDNGHFNLLIADATGAVQALRRDPDVDPRQIGLWGVSQAGWIVPRAAVRARAAFAVLADAPAVTYGEEHEYSRLTGEEGGHPSGLARQEILQRLRPSGFDQRPDLRRMTMPGLWLYGGKDRSQPTNLSVAVLHEVRAAGGKDFRTVVYPDAGHGLLDSTGDPRAIRAMVEWVERRVEARR
jgi:dipeptidyl aminopeptidase/acylaminoacyl peptidase